MLKIYGSRLCPDCVQCLKDLDKAGIPYEYLDFAQSLSALKEYLKLREGQEFGVVRERGMIGIPCIVEEDGTVSLTWEHYVDQG